MPDATPCRSNRVDEIREQARQFRDYAAQTGWATYVELMNRTASDLERMADQMNDGVVAASSGETGKAARIAAELATLIAESHHRRQAAVP